MRTVSSSVGLLRFVGEVFRETGLKRGLFVGRFQPFHLGHLYALKKILGEVDELIIVVGSPQKSHEPDNPFTVGERILMIRGSLSDGEVDPSRYIVIPVPDAEMHTSWVSQIIAYTPPFNIVYTNEPLTRRLLAEAGYKVKGIPLHRRDIYWATEIRKRIISDGNWEELVPKQVARVIRKVEGVNRIKDLLKKDHKAT